MGKANIPLDSHEFDPPTKDLRGAAWISCALEDAVGTAGAMAVAKVGGQTPSRNQGIWKTETKIDRRFLLETTIFRGVCC